ncbi:hypothetical protein J7438_26840, partial [Thalassotalea sp. G20_0]|uniref:hypothetical protein n=1 Tax=Thalassotalea sp. G20_0 TaxID=2821093 RepID=UPI001AD9F11B
TDTSRASIHNYISLIHENIKNRLLFCSEVHFSEKFIKISGCGKPTTPDATNLLFSNHSG